MNEEQMRVEFEDWWKQELLIKYKVDIHEINTYCERTLQGDYTQAATSMRWEGWKAAQSSQAKSVPDGWKLVPIELSPKQKLGMVWAYEEAMGGSRLPDGDGYDFEIVQKMHEAMLATAPQPTDDRVQELERPSKRVLDVIYYCMSNFRDFEEKDWRDHGFTGATFKKAEQFMQKISKL